MSKPHRREAVDTLDPASAAGDLDTAGQVAEPLGEEQVGLTLRHRDSTDVGRRASHRGNRPHPAALCRAAGHIHRTGQADTGTDEIPDPRPDPAAHDRCAGAKARDLMQPPNRRARR